MSKHFTVVLKQWFLILVLNVLLVFLTAPLLITWIGCAGTISDESGVGEVKWCLPG